LLCNTSSSASPLSASGPPPLVILQLPKIILLAVLKAEFVRVKGTPPDREWVTPFKVLDKVFAWEFSFLIIS
jgi:hypothetical protein